ncbi:hypothetical protein ACFPK6_03645 [Dokdonella soli]
MPILEFSQPGRSAAIQLSAGTIAPSDRPERFRHRVCAMKGAPMARVRGINDVGSDREFDRARRRADARAF